MVNSILKETKLLYLILELLKDGRAEIIPELATLEPLEMQQIVDILSKRTGKNYGISKDAWFDWFVNNEEVNKSDRETVSLLKQMLDMENKYLEKIARKQNKTNSCSDDS
jgi:hypothetical protein